MPIYKEQDLTKNAPKVGGKNGNDEDGFYHNEALEEFFIKIPSEEELFTEFLAGLILDELKCHGLIDEAFFPCLMYADIIKLDSGRYGLIQPRHDFTEVYKIIGTGYSDNSDRNPFLEIIAGPHFYSQLAEKKYIGLPLILMLAVLLGNYSVHSANTVVLNKIDTEGFQYIAELDWGATFRNYNHPENNRNPRIPREYLGIKRFTKGYLENYRNIKGLFSAMSEEASLLHAKLTPDLLTEIIEKALKRIPADLIDDKTKNNLADYLYLPSLKRASFGPHGTRAQVAEQLTTTMLLRLNNLTRIGEQSELNKPFPEKKSDYCPIAHADFRQKALEALSQGNLLSFKDCLESATFTLQNKRASSAFFYPNKVDEFILIQRPYLTNENDQKTFMAAAIKEKQSLIIDYLMERGYELSLNDLDEYVKQRDLPSKVMETLVPILQALEKVQNKINDLSSRAYLHEALTLKKVVNTIKKELKDYIDNSNQPDAFGQFQQTCYHPINDAITLVGNHRGHKEILINLGLAILGVGVLYVLAGLIRLSLNQTFYYQVNTDTTNQLQEFQQSIAMKA